MPRIGVSSKQLQATEDDIAILLTGRDAWDRLERWVNGRIRRGYYSEPDEVKAIQSDMERISKAIERGLNRARSDRDGRKSGASNPGKSKRSSLS